MATLADKAILSGADNRPPMLEKEMYDSWKSRMKLYMMNRQHGRMILESVENGPLIWPSIEENEVTRPKKYSELSATEKGESLRDFYLRFSLLLNDMNIYNMKLEQFQVNTKFFNTLPPEWSKFVTDVKLVRDLHTTNIDQLHAYLGQHEFHANEVRLMHERNSDPLALVTTHPMTQSPYQTYQNSYQNTQFHQQVSPYQSPQYGSPYQSQLYSTHQSSTPLSIAHSSNDYQSSVQYNAYSPSSSIPHLEYAPAVYQQQQQSKFPQLDSGLIVLVFQCSRKVLQGLTLREQVEVIQGNKGWLFATTAKGKAICPNSALNPRGNEMIHDPVLPEGQATYTVITHNAAYQADNLDAYDSDCNELNTAKVSLMVNLSYYGLDALAEAAVQNSNSSAQQDALILSVIEQLKTQVVNCTKINLENKSVNDTLTAELERYKEQVKVLKEGQNVDLKSKDNISDSCAQSVEIDHLKQTLSEHLKEKESLMQTVTLLKNDFKKEESRNIDREIALEKRIKQLDNIKAQQLEPKLYVGDIIEKTNAIVIPDSEETLMLAEESRSKMLLKQKDPIMLEKKVNTTPVDYAVLNQLSQDFEKRFVPQTELSAEQAFWSQNSVNSAEPTLSSRPTNVEVPKELPKVSMVNTSLKKLKHHLAGFDVVVKERTTPIAITEGSWGFKHTKACFRDEIIPFVKALKDLFNTFNQYLVDELSEVQNIFHQMEQAVNNIALESTTFEVKINQFLNENERTLGTSSLTKILVTKLIAENENLKQTYKQLYDSIKPVCIRSKEQCDDLINQVNLKSVEIFDLNASLQEKVLVITALKDDLRKLKGKALVDNDVTKHPSDPEMLKIDVEPITPKLLNKQTAHSAYIKHTQEEATVLRDIVEHVKSKYTLDQSLEYTCRYAKVVQELFKNISKTCPSVNNTDGKIVAVTPKNKDKRVRFTKPVTSSGNIITKTTSTSNLVSNKPMLSSTGVKPSTSASGSQPSGNTKKDKIRQTPSSTQKNKVEAHPRKVKSSLKNKDCVIQPNGTAHVQHSKLNANSEFKLPLRKPTALENETPKPVVKLVYSKKPRKSKTNVPISKAKVLKSVSANKKEPSPSWGSIVSDIPSSSLDECRSSKLFSGLGHSLFFVGKFCDSNLEVAFRQHACFIRNLERVDLLTGSRGNNLYTLSLRDMMASSPISLLSKASNTKSWLWHRHKSKKKPHKLKSEDTNQEKLYLLHMDLYGPMSVTSVNGKKYNLFIVDDYSRFTWVKFLRSKDEAPDFIIKFLKMIQVRLKVPIRRIRTDNGTEFVNQTLREYYEKAEAVTTACYTQNCSIVRLSHDFDELTAMASEHSSSGPALHEMTPATISSGLVPNPPPSTPFIPPSRTD
ncbi:retrovirus-related pol polyprotein from transposon TNT 1-94 [Tanacetum coccineum]|uniref:Retrovirus-related pol polyprotein from transposon TNT 1-94 n=1 Tax=Tanacetum coccineum TaxID=301880 RepID=A0ABQ4Y566_9ASTR